jgi:SUN domain-containing protein 1/2
MANVTMTTKTSDDFPDRDEVQRLIRSALVRYDADKTGSFDYALETAGGSVVSTRCTETFYSNTAAWTLFGIPLWRPSNNPRTAIQPGVLPGECWAFKGSRGYLVIGLSVPVVPTRFSLEHIPRSMSPSGAIDSAPREFTVLGLRMELDPSPIVLGTYAYDVEGEPLQTFDVQHDAGLERFSIVQLDILSNHGNMKYTCLYRFRVHGKNV